MQLIRTEPLLKVDSFAGKTLSKYDRQERDNRSPLLLMKREHDLIQKEVFLLMHFEGNFRGLDIKFFDRFSTVFSIFLETRTILICS